MKQKWYRNSLVKGLWILIVHAAAVALAICLALGIGMYAVGLNPLEESKPYIQSPRFRSDLYNKSWRLLSDIKMSDFLAKADNGGLIDLENVINSETLSDLTEENTSGLSYSAKDLVDWCSSGWEYGDFTGEDSSIVTCVKPDKTFMYYYYKDFEQLVKNKEIVLDFGPDYSENQAQDATAELLNLLAYNHIPQSTATLDLRSVKNSNGQELYTEIYNYTDMLVPEVYPPSGAQNLLEVLNENPYWNERIYEAYYALNKVLNMIGSDYADVRSSLSHYEEGNTNLTYFFVDKTNKRVCTNKSAYDNYSTYEASLKEIAATDAYVMIYPKLSSCKSSFLDEQGSLSPGLSEWHHTISNLTDKGTDYIFAIQIDTDFPAEDFMAKESRFYNQFQDLTIPVIRVAVCALVFLLLGLIWLTITAGRSSKDDGIHLLAFDRMFTEIAAALTAGLWFMGIFFGINFADNVFSSGAHGEFGLQSLCILAGAAGLFTAILFCIGYLSLVRRIKAKTLWKNSLLRWVLGFRKVLVRFLKKIGRLLHRILEIYSRNTPGKIKLTVFFAAVFLFQFFCLALSFGMYPEFLLLLLPADLALLLYLLYRADGREKLLDGLKRISGGELGYKIPLEKLTGEQKTMAEYINNIGSGLDAAVENSLKNERMKTELITNVSHDLKTPLTSIINYIDLLKRENFTDEKICGYLKILEEKAQRLKVLTEDVVEASKASTGNITLNMTDLNFVELLHQVIGEFEERFQDKHLTMMVHFPDEPSMIYADGQRMWRVLENIFTNVSKYALEGTRVYAEVKNTGQQVVFSLKNISAQPLNISADELTERFIRGDGSRNTEGSGLGLSIAKSLTELQGGEFNLYLDGDLFKVTITFALCRNPKK